MASNFRRIVVTIAAAAAVAIPASTVAVTSTVDDGAANGLKITAKANGLKANGL